MKKPKIKGIEIANTNKLNSYGFDVESELLKILSEEIAKEIDKDILRGLGYEPDRRLRRKSKIEKILNSLNNSR